VKALEQAGALPYEIVGLWPEDEPGSTLPRARFWAWKRDWAMVAAELERRPGAAPGPWTDALQGAVALFTGEVERGVASWSAALAGQTRQPAAGLDDWFAWLAGALPPPAAAAVGGRLAERVAQIPCFTVALARQLQSQKQWALAEQLLLLSARARPEADVFQAWAELALQMQNPTAALGYARRAWELSPQTPSWGRWFDGFEAHPAQGVTKLRQHRVVQGIELVRAVEGDGGDAGLVVKQNGLIRHKIPFESQPCSTGRRPVPLNQKPSAMAPTAAMLSGCHRGLSSLSMIRARMPSR
jgi:hypothetical protein